MVTGGSPASMAAAAAAVPGGGARQRARGRGLGGRGGSPAHPGGDGDDGTARGGQTATVWWSTVAARGGEDSDGGDDCEHPVPMPCAGR